MFNSSSFKVFLTEKNFLNQILYFKRNILGGYIKYKRVVELVDTRDLKSLDSDIVPVQVRPRVPLKIYFEILLQYIKIKIKLN